jgi:hypothetical protein
MNLVIETLGDPESQSHFLSTYIVRTPTIVLVGSKQSPRRNENIIVNLEKMLFHVKQIAFERECHSNVRVVRTVIEHSNGAAIFGLK